MNEPIKQISVPVPAKVVARVVREKTDKVRRVIEAKHQYLATLSVVTGPMYVRGLELGPNPPEKFANNVKALLF